ncbi:MAG TPA: RHS repeat-associated core domain-containing protein, partial [Fimbriimonadaceae bacterium]|nr:RHS repeat-associated core domain-containing protein [Fimbriimonadaceae bacterium]
TYDAFGAETTTGTTPTDPFGYNAQAGYLFDRDTGLYLCQHRYYDPTSGRWVTRDPIGYGGGIGLYAYCSNGAAGFMDPSGLSPILQSPSKASPPMVVGTCTPGGPTGDDGGLDWEFWDNPDNAAYQVIVGVGDGASFGLSNAARDAMGTSDMVNEDSPYYKAGLAGGTALGTVITDGAGDEAAGQEEVEGACENGSCFVVGTPILLAFGRNWRRTARRAQASIRTRAKSCRRRTSFRL